ncbi:MAG: hypothetical protein BJ554DRAFT_2525 [Olpidium bornovanus]|uniref:Uncharacterized protein n=1 Tax=Olpidium bornovanus TaxID=278681 RepID=A0A8H7ZQB6_9FUNG|nr:MAG: hypothetical protein BJ554DRAFT_2525 [Olpidium bornovanus]
MLRSVSHQPGLFGKRHVSFGSQNAVAGTPATDHTLPTDQLRRPGDAVTTVHGRPAAGRRTTRGVPRGHGRAPVWIAG